MPSWTHVESIHIRKQVCLQLAVVCRADGRETAESCIQEDENEHICCLSRVDTQERFAAMHDSNRLFDMLRCPLNVEIHSPSALAASYPDKKGSLDFASLIPTAVPEFCVSVYIHIAIHEAILVLVLSIRRP